MPSVTVILVTGGQVTEIFARFGKKLGNMVKYLPDLVKNWAIWLNIYPIW
jgi:hypothetical protein